MKKKPRKYLKFYNECMESGLLPKVFSPYTGGLCSIFHDDELFQLFAPSEHGWLGEGYSLSDSDSDDLRAFGFCDNRQNVVLLMAAMNNEL